MSLYLSKAGQAEIIRSAQKDAQFIDDVHLTLSELVRRYSQRSWISMGEKLRILVEIFYYSYHAVLGIQTLGEEYTGIVQIDSNYSSLPNRLVLCVTLEYGGELALRKGINCIKKDIKKQTELRSQAKTAIIRALDIFLDFIPLLQAVHRGLFYFKGGSYQLSKRLSGINYVLVRYWLKQDHSVLGYKLLGVLTLLQTFIGFIVYIRKQFLQKPFKHQKQSTLTRLSKDVSLSSSKLCILCMENRKNVSAISCGHMFCWNCIIEWLQTKNECPVCREPTKPSNVIYLVNYQGI